MRLNELKESLLGRKYKKRVVEDAFKRLERITREEYELLHDSDISSKVQYFRKQYVGSSIKCTTNLDVT